MINTALLLIALSGDMVYELKLPTMEECMKARTQIEEQNTYYDTVCIPIKDNPIVEWIERFHPCDDNEFSKDREWQKKFRD